MRLAITHPYSWPEVRRGTERIVMESGRALAARGHSVTIFSAGWRPGVERRPGLTIVRLPRVFRDPLKHQRWFGGALMPLLMAGRFDAVHSMMPQDAQASWRASRVTGHRVVYEEMGIPWRWYWDTLPDGDLRLWLVDRVDVYGCMSQHALDVMEKELGRRGTLIPGGVRLSEFAPAARREERPTILFSGALGERHKGLGDLLQAVDLLLPEIPDLQVWVSGQGDPGAILAEAPPAARRATQVLQLGAPGDQAQRYARAWATALPSEGDSFGLVLIESLASGTPIVVADDAAPPTLVTPETGAVAALHDPPSLAEALRAALDLAKRPETSQRCREFAEQYDWDGAIAPLLEEIYSGVPARRRPAAAAAERAGAAVEGRAGATQAPAVSVVVSSYRRPDRLERLLRSLAEQTLPLDSFEVLAVDNASADETGELLERLAAELPYRLVPLSTSANRGPAPARNLGWQHAGASVVAFTDDDCVPEPEWLEAGVAALEADPRLGILQGRTKAPDDVDECLYVRWNHRQVIDSPTPHFESCNLFCRREALEETGGYDEDIGWWGEDTALGWGIVAAGWERGFAPDAVVTHDVTNRSVRWHFFNGLREYNMVRLAGRHPEFREEAFWRPWAYRKTDAAFVGAVVGGLVATRWRPAALAVLPYLWWQRPSVRRPEFFVIGAERVAVDAARTAGQLWGAIRYRVGVI